MQENIYKLLRLHNFIFCRVELLPESVFGGRGESTRVEEKRGGEEKGRGRQEIRQGEERGGVEGWKAEDRGKGKK